MSAADERTRADIAAAQARKAERRRKGVRAKLSLHDELTAKAYKAAAVEAAMRNGGRR